MTNIIYKIETAEAWQKAQSTGVYTGSALDVMDGFIHLSTADQVRETANKWFAGQNDLILASIDSAQLGDMIKWEPSRDGALFPHVYGILPMSAVIETAPMCVGEDGLYLFGPHIT